MLVKTKISVNALEIGMTVVELDRPWTDLPFLLQGVTLKDQFDITTLQRHCKFVYIEYEYQDDLPQDEQPLVYAKPSETQDPEKSNGFIGKAVKPRTKKKANKLQTNTSLEQELPRAQHIYVQAKKQLGPIFDEVRSTKMLNVRAAEKMVSSCLGSIISNANALFWLTRIKDTNHVTADHCLRVSVLSMALGHFLGMEKRQLEILGIAALLHDVGKTQLPPEILRKNRELTRTETRVMQRHTALGFDLLHADSSLAPAIKDVAFNHHRKIDGSGYPEKTMDQPLSLFTKIVSIIDAYDNMTHDTPCRRAKSPKSALAEIHKQADQHFDKQLVSAFVSMMGIYPSGSLVRMTNGEIGIVVSSDPARKDQPKIELICNHLGHLRNPLIVDLQKSPSDQDGYPYKIGSSLPDAFMQLDMEDYLAERLNLSF